MATADPKTTEAVTTGIPAEIVLKMVRGLMEFPFPQICRHLVATELLAALDGNGYPVRGELLDAVFCARDDEALAMLPQRSESDA